MQISVKMKQFSLAAPVFYLSVAGVVDAVDSTHVAGAGAVQSSYPQL
jgi:hypothetical protein